MEWNTYFAQMTIINYFCWKTPHIENARILSTKSRFPGPWPLFGIFEKIGANLHSTKGVILHGRAAFFQPPDFWTMWAPQTSGVRGGGPGDRPPGSGRSPAWVGTGGSSPGKNSDQNQAPKPKITKKCEQNTTWRRLLSKKSHAFPTFFFGKSSLSAILRKTNLHLTTIFGGSL